jgi:hypothetical protein
MGGKAHPGRTGVSARRCAASLGPHCRAPSDADASSASNARSIAEMSRFPAVTRKKVSCGSGALEAPRSVAAAAAATSAAAARPRGEQDGRWAMSDAAGQREGRR